MTKVQTIYHKLPLPARVTLKSHSCRKLRRHIHKIACDFSTGLLCCLVLLLNTTADRLLFCTVVVLYHAVHDIPVIVTESYVKSSLSLQQQTELLPQVVL